MKRTIRFTPPARAQFVSAVAYIKADRPGAARDFRNRVNEALLQLVDFPESGRVIPEFPQLQFRELIVDRYRIFYRTAEDTVWVVAVWHEAQVAGEPESAGG